MDAIEVLGLVSIVLVSHTQTTQPSGVGPSAMQHAALKEQTLTGRVASVVAPKVFLQRPSRWTQLPPGFPYSWSP